jgi:ribosomal protein L13E
VGVIFIFILLLFQAAKMAPRPIQRLRPMVTCPTFKYNVKKRAGR